MDWMIIEQTLEEELYLEATVREIHDCDDLEKLRSLCVSLTRQGWHQTKLIQQAVGHIASLDQAMLPS